MAKRPIFLASTQPNELFREVEFDFHWHPGFAPIQKQRNVAALHASAAEAGHTALLEVSTKSEDELGRNLSAFNLTVQTKAHGEIPLECAFQGSKVFEQGGPFQELYAASSRAARKDPRLRESGRLTGFQLEDQPIEADPKTAFYDWLYIRAVSRDSQKVEALQAYEGFTDIEFNPKKSLNCQARACAELVSLHRQGSLAEAIESHEAFFQMARGVRPQEHDAQSSLF